MPVFDRFLTAVARPMPFGYLVSGGDTLTLRRLALHGFSPVPMADHSPPVPPEQFVLDSVARSTRPFQGHREVTLTGRWAGARTGGVDDPRLFVTTPSRGTLLMYLLEPESEDGFATWNGFDDAISRGRPYPVLRLPARGPADR
jgi:hypothetical protein